MPFHTWDDEWFEEHGNDLYSAIHLCMEGWTKWGRIGTHGKEKFGVFRDQLYPYRAEWPIHELVKPGHVYYCWPKWLMQVELVLGAVVRKTPIPWLVLKWQAAVYNYYVQKACKLYPEVIDEIVSDLDYYEWVQPGLFGPIDGIQIHNQYWERCDLMSPVDPNPNLN